LRVSAVRPGGLVPPSDFTTLSAEYHPKRCREAAD
jgi:hypothetical protein